MSGLRSLWHLRPRLWAQGFHLTRRVQDSLLVSDSVHVTAQGALSTSQGPRCLKLTNKFSSVKENSQDRNVSTSSPVDQTISTDSESSLFDELLPPSLSRIASPKLLTWEKSLRAAQKARKPFDMKSITASSSFPLVVEECLQISSSAMLRQRLLMLLLNQTEDDEWTEKVLKRTLSVARQLPIKAIADLVLALSTCTQTPLRLGARKAMVSAVVSQRWYEIGQGHVVFFMYELDDLFDMRALCAARHRQQVQALAQNKNSGETSKTDISPSVSNNDSERDSSVSVNLEARAISLADQLKVKDLSRIVTLLAKWRNRNETLLNAVLYRLCLADMNDFSFIQLNNLLFACSVLSIYNTDVLKKLCSTLKAETPPSPSLACSMLNSLSHLRWKDPDLVSVTLDAVRDRVEQLSARDVGSLLLSLANLYTVPLREQDTILVKDLLSKALKDANGPDCVTYTWCSAVLQQTSAEQAAQALDPVFVKQFMDGLPEASRPFHLQRLSTISLVAKFEVEGYTGPLLSEDILRSFPVIVPRNIEKNLSTTFVKALEKFADLGTYASLSPNIPGIPQIDAVIVANAQGELRPLAEADKGAEMFKLACQVVPFFGVMSSDQSTVGSYQVSSRILSHLGYVPVQILFSDLRPNQTPLEHVNNIQSRIRAAVKDHSERCSPD